MRILRWLKTLAGSLIRLAYLALYRLIPVDAHMVLFVSFHGRGYSDNPRAIFLEMKEDSQFKNDTFIWAIKHQKQKKIEIPGAKVIEYFSIPYFYYLARSKYWVFNCKMPGYIRKKKNQVYLQTWHGTPLKKLGHDIDVAEDTTFYRSGLNYEQMCRTYDTDVARYNYMISPNAFCSEVFPSAFGIDSDRLKEIGYPRNDFLSNVTEEQTARLKQKLGIPEGKKVLLYAPTWRDNSYVAAGYTFQLEADFHKWKDILGDEYAVVFKPHYLIINHYENDPSLEGFLYQADASSEISELYPIADALITDYSSVFFDYAILKRPIYFYMYDLETYASNLRGFYLDIYKDLPGKIYRTEEEMLKDVKQGIYDFSRMDAFNARFNNREDGQAARRAVALLKETV